MAPTKELEKKKKEYRVNTTTDITVGEKLTMTFKELVFSPALTLLTDLLAFFVVHPFTANFDHEVSFLFEDKRRDCVDTFMTRPSHRPLYNVQSLLMLTAKCVDRPLALMLGLKYAHKLQL
ncbi:hypothetical protein pdam_00023945 [Pocillopora damicornis]|uniref:Uncharacterized protein n=1 Tax=Pocillopora damicornis TaxID=46731 RepID=A0A3M6V3R4_POCDA|nr:hypothetical protein pdam_00023945 [Pocillopora damicornis]